MNTILAIAAGWSMVAIWDGISYSMSGSGFDTREDCIREILANGWDSRPTTDWDPRLTREPALIGCVQHGVDLKPLVLDLMRKRKKP